MSMLPFSHSVFIDLRIRSAAQHVRIRLFRGFVLILLATALAAPTGSVESRERHSVTAKQRAAYRKLKRDLWGPAKMPPAPTDFGPHFDFPPEPLNGGLNHDPYPN